ncbi:MAG: metal-dependent hydrolase [Thermoguttaceae bacterium]
MLLDESPFYLMIRFFRSRSRQQTCVVAFDIVFAGFAEKMADFRTHLTYSTGTGVLYGGVLSLFGFPLPSCALAGGACAISGMLPDIDSKSSRALQECLYLAAGIVAMLTVSRLREFAINGDIVIFFGALAFLFVRFIVGAFVRNFTVHRGMMHSVPVALLVGEIGFLLSSGTPLLRCIKAGGITLGFLSHLVLDEVYSIDANGREFKLKKSFGTAFKFLDKSSHKNLLIYGILIASTLFVWNEPYLIAHFFSNTGRIASIGSDALLRYSEEVYGDEVMKNKVNQQLAWFRALGGDYWGYGETSTGNDGTELGQTTVNAGDLGYSEETGKDFAADTTGRSETVQGLQMVDSRNFAPISEFNESSNNPVLPFNVQRTLPQQVQEQFREPVLESRGGGGERVSTTMNRQSRLSRFPRFRKGMPIRQDNQDQPD